MDLSAPIKKAAVIYLHGFASGTGSTKARYFKNKLVDSGFTVALPDLNVPSFESMTLTSQLALVQKTAEDIGEEQPLILIGSSLGGLLATLFAQQWQKQKGQQSIERMILLAPGFGIKRRWRELIGEEALKQWQADGYKPYFHYGANRELNLAYGFIEDLDRYPTDSLSIDIPTLVFHGVDDQTVPIQNSRDFKAISGAYVQLEELADGHELIASLPAIWQVTERFLQKN